MELLIHVIVSVKPYWYKESLMCSQECCDIDKYVSKYDVEM